MNKTPLRIINARKLQFALMKIGFHIHIDFLDPLSTYNEKHKRVDYKVKELNVLWKGNSLKVPLDYYLHTDVDFLAESMAVEFALGFDANLAADIITDISSFYPTMVPSARAAHATDHQLTVSNNSNML